MPPPNNKDASDAAVVMFAEQQRRFNEGFTMDRYPASHSDLIYCALALMDAGWLPPSARAALHECVFKRTDGGGP